MEREKWIKFYAEQNALLEEKVKKKKRRKQLQEYGKLGGRPPKTSERKKNQVKLSLTDTEIRLLEQRAEQVGLSKQDYLRKFIKYATPPEPLDPERNKLLIQAKVNFKRISNHFKSGVWDNAEKKAFTSLLIEVIELIESDIK